MLKLINVCMYLIFASINIIMVNGGKNCCGKNSKEDVLCQHKLKGPAKHCINYERTVNSIGEKQLLLDKINSRRNKVAAGEIRSLRSAENMLALEWNEELAVAAQFWADQCVPYSVPDIKDTCRDLDNSSVEQNIATIYDDSPGLTPTMLVDLWYIELLNVNSSVISKYQKSSGSDHYDYFTQLIWAETSHVGCGAVKFKEQMQRMEGNRNRTVYRLVCNFWPSGNQVGKSVYSVGLPCSRCQYNAGCDPGYNALCASGHSSTMNSLMKRLTHTESSNVSKGWDNDTDILSRPESKQDYDENISFEFFTKLLELTTKSSTYHTGNTTVCKDILIVDELFDLLKRKLSDDQTLRDLLLIKKSSKYDNTEETFTDPSVAEMLSHIYTTIEPSTIRKTTNDYLNSTLLVDLVEAVIFRNNDKISTSTITDIISQSVNEVSPVQIRAELGEIKYNSDFTGHYFFPEDNNDDLSSDKQTDNYYDITDVPSSDVAFEIENLKRYKGTKDFLEEILDSDFVTEAISEKYIINSNHSIEGNNTS